MAASFSRSRVAGVALAVLLSLSACGGGGGGTTPPPPPPVDTTPPKVQSWTPPDGTEVDLSQGAVTLSIVMDEAFNCPGQNPIVITKGNGDEVKGGTYACDAPTKTLSLVFDVAALFRCETYTVTLPKGSVKDLAGNALAGDSKITIKTKCPKVAMLFTANASAGQGEASVSGVELSDGKVSGYVPNPSKIVSGQTAVVADPETGLVWSSSSDFKSIDVLEVETGNVVSMELDPSDNGGTVECAYSLVKKDRYIWAAWPGECGHDPKLINRAFMIDRLTKEVVGTTDPVTGPDNAVFKLIAHPDAAVHRLYALNMKPGTTVFIECEVQCRRGYRSFMTGSVTEIDSQTGAILRTFAVGAAPLGAAIDPTKNRLYVANTGESSLSVVNLDTGTVGTVPLPEFTGYRQPIGVAILAGKLWLSDYLDSVWVYDPDMTLVGSVALGTQSVPTDVLALDGKLYVALMAGNAVVELNADLSENRRFAVGAGPVSLTGYVSGQ